jgi:hypothetical protein
MFLFCRRCLWELVNSSWPEECQFLVLAPQKLVIEKVDANAVICCFCGSRNVRRTRQRWRQMPPSVVRRVVQWAMSNVRIGGWTISSTGTSDTWVVQYPLYTECRTVRVHIIRIEIVLRRCPIKKSNTSSVPRAHNQLILGSIFFSLTCGVQKKWLRYRSYELPRFLLEVDGD